MLKKSFIAALLLLSALPVLAKDQTPASYQDATLTGIRRVQAGDHCRAGGDVDSNTTGNVDSNGYYNATTSGTVSETSNCTPVYQMLYTVRVGADSYVVTPKHSPLTTTPVGSLFASMKHSALDNTIPGSPIKVRSSGGHFYVSNGSKETEFTIVSAGGQ